MHQLAPDEGSTYPIGSALLEDFYIDDLTSDDNLISEVINKMQQTSKILSCANSENVVLVIQLF